MLTPITLPPASGTQEAQEDTALTCPWTLAWLGPCHPSLEPVTPLCSPDSAESSQHLPSCTHLAPGCGQAWEPRRSPSNPRSWLLQQAAAWASPAGSSQNRRCELSAWGAPVCLVACSWDRLVSKQSGAASDPSPLNLLPRTTGLLCLPSRDWHPPAAPQRYPGVPFASPQTL